jgi:hypothetical protein
MSLAYAAAAQIGELPKRAEAAVSKRAVTRA